MELHQVEDLNDIIIDLVLGDDIGAMKLLEQRFSGAEMVDIHNLYLRLDKLAQMVWTLKGEPEAERLER